jgi:hypothetical protein
MQEKSKRADAYPTSDFRVSRTINASGSDYHVGYSKLFSILGDQLLLPDLGIAIRFATVFGVFFRRARFVQAP